MQVITIESEAFQHLLSQIQEIKTKLIEERKQQPLSEVWLDNSDVCRLLNISKRTLQTYRDSGIISFSQIGAKIYYKASDVEKLLEANYKASEKKNLKKN